MPASERSACQTEEMRQLYDQGSKAAEKWAAGL